MINENKNESPESPQTVNEKAQEESMAVQEIVPEKKKRGKKVFPRNPMPKSTA